MPTWLIIIIVVAIAGAILGFIGSNDGERGEGAAAGAAAGALGCGYILLNLFIAGLSIGLIIWLFTAIFG